MTAVMEVHVRTKCECETGTVYAHDWTTYFADADHQARVERLRHAREYEQAADLDAIWWTDHGYPDALPAEEHPCPECQGTTWVEKWVDVRAFSNDLVVV